MSKPDAIPSPQNQEPPKHQPGDREASTRHGGTSRAAVDEAAKDLSSPRSGPTAKNLRDAFSTGGGSLLRSAFGFASPESLLGDGGAAKPKAKDDHSAKADQHTGDDHSKIKSLTKPTEKKHSDAMTMANKHRRNDRNLTTKSTEKKQSDAVTMNASEQERNDPSRIVVGTPKEHHTVLKANEYDFKANREQRGMARAFLEKGITAALGSNGIKSLSLGDDGKFKVELEKEMTLPPKADDPLKVKVYIGKTIEGQLKVKKEDGSITITQLPKKDSDPKDSSPLGISVSRRFETSLLGLTPNIGVRSPAVDVTELTLQKGADGKISATATTHYPAWGGVKQDPMPITEKGADVIVGLVGKCAGLMNDPIRRDKRKEQIVDNLPAPSRTGTKMD